MNISSLIIRVKDEDAARFILRLTYSGLCECHDYENGKLIVTIDGEDTGEEIEKIRQIKMYPEVISIDMIYAYSENELDKAKESIEINQGIPEWLNKENVDANEIKYSGLLK